MNPRKHQSNQQTGKGLGWKVNEDASFVFH